MFGKLAALFFIITIVTLLIVIFTVSSQGQLQTVDEFCAPLSVQHPHNGFITVHNTTSNEYANYSSGTFCNYQLNYYYDWGNSWIAPVVAAIITVVFAIIYFGWESRTSEDDDVTEDDDEETELERRLKALDKNNRKDDELPSTNMDK